MSLFHLDYEIDKKFWKDLFYEHANCGHWHHTCMIRQELYWWQILIRPDHNSHLLKFTDEIAKDLNIHGMDNYPRLNYTYPNRYLPHHVDPDNMIAININLMETTPTIHIEHKPYPYECALIDVGGKMHGIEKEPNDRLILKFCLRHPWNEVYERLDKRGLIISNGSEKV